MRTIHLASMLAILLIAVGSTRAAVALTNASWESPDVNDLANTNGTATGWTANTGAGVFDPQNAWFAGTTGNNVQGTLPDGGQVGFTNNLNGGGTIIGQMTQNVGTIGANEKYTLTVAVGRDALGTAFGSYLIRLIANGTTVLATAPVVTPANGTWVDVSATTPWIVTGDPLVGQTLSVLIAHNTTSASQNYYDNARLVTSVPEPASLSLLGGGILALAARRRR